MGKAQKRYIEAVMWKRKRESIHVEVKQQFIFMFSGFKCLTAGLKLKVIAIE